MADENDDCWVAEHLREEEERGYCRRYRDCLKMPNQSRAYWEKYCYKERGYLYCTPQEKRRVI